MHPRRWRWTLLAMAAVASVLALHHGWARVANALPACSFRRLTGLYCPGCGGTRCTGKLLKGELAGALSMNAIVVILAAAAITLLGITVAREWKGRAPAFPILPTWFAWGITGLIVVFGLVRNLPWWPFTLLVPH